MLNRVLCSVFFINLHGLTVRGTALLNKVLCSLLVFSALQLESMAQTDTLPPYFTYKGAAIGLSSPEMIDLMMVTMPGLGSNAKDMLNEQSVKPYIMPPRNARDQNRLSSYAIATCMEFYNNFEKNYKVNLSPDFITLSLIQEGNEDLKNALRFLVTDGTVSADIMPYGSTSIPRSVFATERYKISNYLHIFRESYRERQKVFETQKALMRGNPVIVELKVPEDFSQIKNTRFWAPLGKSGDMVLPFVIVSYNLQLEAFEVLSAWGREWGSNGYLWIDFNDFGKLALNGYVMVP